MNTTQSLQEMQTQCAEYLQKYYRKHLTEIRDVESFKQQNYAALESMKDSVLEGIPCSHCKVEHRSDETVVTFCSRCATMLNL